MDSSRDRSLLRVRTLSVLLLCASISSPLADRGDEAVDRRARLQGMRSELSRLEAELVDLQGRESGLLGELERLGAELRLRRAELEHVTLRRREVVDEVAVLVSQLQALNRSQQERRGYLAFRLREIYKAGPDQALRRLLGDDAIDRYWEGVRYASYLNDRDARVLRAYREDAQRLEQQRARLEQRRAALEQLQTELEGRRRRLERSRSQRGRLLEEIRDDRDKREVAVRELEGAAAELARVVAGLEPTGDAPALDMRKFRGLIDWPADGEISAGFGSAVHPRFKTRVPHPGLDIDGEFGASIRNIFDGQVVFASWMRGYGLTAIVDHGGGILSVYAHASVLMVEPGERLLRGQRIGAIGDTGSLRGPYLYFEIRENGRPTDPAAWLRPR